MLNLIACLTALVLAATASPRPGRGTSATHSAPEPFTIRPWTLGMTRQQVLQAGVGPFYTVPVTGGVETPNGIFERARCNVSFVFDRDDRLSYIQVWAYEGRRYEDARTSAVRIYRLFQRHCGGVEVSGLSGAPPNGVSPERFAAVLDGAYADAEQKGEENRLLGHQISIITCLRPVRQPPNAELMGQVVYRSRVGVYQVFLFQDLTGRPRRFDTRIDHEPWQQNLQLRSPPGRLVRPLARPSGTSS